MIGWGWSVNKEMVKYVIIATVTGFLAGGGISLIIKLINKKIK